MSIRIKMAKDQLRPIYYGLRQQYHCLLTMISPELNIKTLYREQFGKKLDLSNPQTLNEKLLWLKLNDYIKNPLVIRCADKYTVREYIREQGCGEILNELYGVYDSADEINWDELPEQFVMKWNFGAGMNIVCTDKSKLDIPATVEQLRKWGKRKYWLTHAEMQYKYAPKKIICERLLNGAGADAPAGTWVAPEDYKVYCFNGEPKYTLVCVGRELDTSKGIKPKFYFYDENWELARINRDSIAAPEDFKMEKRPGMDQLLEYARKLAQPFPFVRADFYVLNGKVYFGELTFTPSGGMDPNRLPETDLMMGKLLKLPE